MWLMFTCTVLYQRETICACIVGKPLAISCFQVCLFGTLCGLFVLLLVDCFLVLLFVNQPGFWTLPKEHDMFISPVDYMQPHTNFSCLENLGLITVLEQDYLKHPYCCY